MPDILLKKWILRYKGRKEIYNPKRGKSIKMVIKINIKGS